MTSLIRIFTRAYPDVYSRLLLVYLASLTRRVLLQALPSTCVAAILTGLMEGYLKLFPFLYVKEECPTERTMGHSYGYWVPLEVKSLIQGCSYSDLCLVFAAQREGFQPVDREF